ncbi:MAG: hypothetical protein J07HR59_01138 [Halorubrum sp. J07HR59]|nr:MAG: hypothetical protein J07HR59_01138 [Halorubrum sp. J07HR59]
MSSHQRHKSRHTLAAEFTAADCNIGPSGAGEASDFNNC